MEATGGEPARGGDRLELPRGLVREMLTYARSQLPNEACGLLGGRAGRAERFYPATNQEASPTAYSIPAEELLRILTSLEGEQLELVAVFHSHPRGRAYPSPVDIRQAYYPEAVYLIASLAGPEPELRGYRIRRGRAERVALAFPGEGSAWRGRPEGATGRL